MSIDDKLPYVQLVLEKFKKNHFARFLGFEFTGIELGKVSGFLDIKPEHKQQNGFAHGGLALTLCDITAGFAAWTYATPDQHIVTAEIKISCLRPAIGERLFVNGWVIKPGKNIHFCESEVYSGNNDTRKQVAKSSSSMAVVRLDGYNAN